VKMPTTSASGIRYNSLPRRSTRSLVKNRLELLRSRICVNRESAGRSFLVSSRTAKPIARHLVADPFDFLPRKQWRLTDLQAAVILTRPGLDLDGEPERPRKRLSGRKSAVMFQQAGQTSFKRLDRMVGQLRRAVGRIWRAADALAACGRDHVVDGWNLESHDGQDRAIGRVRVHDGFDLVARAQDVQMESPFA